LTTSTKFIDKIKRKYIKCWYSVIILKTNFI
jgi:hypothetical protein